MNNLSTATLLKIRRGSAINRELILTHREYELCYHANPARANQLGDRYDQLMELESAHWSNSFDIE